MCSLNDVNNYDNYQYFTEQHPINIPINANNMFNAVKDISLQPQKCIFANREVDDFLMHPNKSCAKAGRCQTCVLYNKEYCVVCLCKHTDNLNIVKIKLLEILEYSGIEWDDMTIERVMRTPHNHHLRRIQNADLNYPILLYVVSKNALTNEINYAILDGYHRLAQAYLTGLDEIKCRIVPENIMKRCTLNK